MPMLEAPMPSSREGALKQVEEAVEGLVRVVRGSCSRLGLANGKDLQVKVGKRQPVGTCQLDGKAHSTIRKAPKQLQSSSFNTS